jgi:hypothetical protein
LVELKISAQAQNSALEVIVGDRYRIAISSGFDSRLLGELVRALESLA